MRVVKALMDERRIPKEAAAELLGITTNWSECRLNADEALRRLNQWADNRDSSRAAEVQAEADAAAQAAAEADIPF